LRLPVFRWSTDGRTPEITPRDFKRWLDEGRPVQILDARTGLEHRVGTIVNARHAPMTEMPGSMARLDLDQSQPVVVLCLSGHRSLPGTRWLRAHGYEAYSLKGGLLAWKRAGYRLDPPNGRAAGG